MFYVHMTIKYSTELNHTSFKTRKRVINHIHLNMNLKKKKKKILYFEIIENKMVNNYFNTFICFYFLFFILFFINLLQFH
jgi:hypothetical protein